MKLTHKLCGAALLAAIGIGAALPSSNVKADEPDHNITGKVDVEFTLNETEEDTTKSDNTGGSGDGPIISGEVTTDVKGFGVNAVGDLSFKTEKILSSGELQTAYAKNWVGETATGKIENNNYIRFKDTKVTEVHEYEVSAKLTRPFSTKVGTAGNEQEKAINGATITFTDGRVTSEDATAPEASQFPDASAGALVVEEGKQTVFVKNQKPAGAVTFDKGYGSWRLGFGEYKHADDTSAVTGTGTRSDQAVQLSIPREKNALLDKKYTGEITWYMSRTFQP